MLVAETNQEETRLFFVTDSIEDNEEIFDTLEAAEAYIKTMPIETSEGEPSLPRLRICLVRNAYLEDYQEGQSWNYDDQADTFETIKTLEVAK